MSRLFLRSVFLLLLFAAANYIILLHTPDPGNQREFFQYLHKKTEMLDSIPPPRLIVVGGSSALFSQNSRLFEELLGVPVINMGTLGHFGLRYMITNVQGHIRRGDIVLLAPEYWQFNGSSYEGRSLLAELVLNNPDALRNIRSPGQLRMLLAHAPRLAGAKLQHRLARLTGLEMDKAKTGDSTTTPRADLLTIWRGYHGDFSRRDSVSAEHPLMHWWSLKNDPIDEAAVEGVTRFREHCLHLGAEFCFVYPPIPEAYYRENSAWLARLHSALQQALPSAVLWAPAESSYPQQWFLDSIYHLNAIGGDRRTRDMARVLRDWLTKARAQNRSEMRDAAPDRCVLEKHE